MSLKKSIKKSVAAFITLTLVYSNFHLCGLGLSKVIAQNLQVPELLMSLENSKYVQYAEQENNEEVNSGVAIQTNIQIGANYNEETYLPVKSNEISLKLPALNGKMPEKAVVVDSDTLLSTGEENNNNINQSYDKDSGLLTVSYENSQAYANNTQDLKDEFEIIYIYSAEAYTGNAEEITLEYELSAKTTFTIEQGICTSQRTKTFTLQEKENKGNLTTFNITESKENIYKGFMYANVENNTSYDTEFTTVSDFCVLDSRVSNEVLLEMKEASFVTNEQEETLISSNGLIEYISTKINKSEFDNVLGSNGSIEIYEGETIIATIRYIEVEDESKLAVIYADESTNYQEETITVEYPEGITSLKIKMSAPIAEGYIHFENNNKIKATKDYGVNVQKIKNIQVESIVDESSNTQKIKLLEPETKIGIDSSNKNFSTIQNNETTITVTLDDTNESAKLFNSPTITVKLPDGLESAKISSVNIINGNGLEIKEDVAIGEDKHSIIIQLSGNQTSYDLNNISGGATIVLELDNIDYKDTLPTHTDEIQVSCVQGEGETQEKIDVSQEVNIVSKAGLLVLSKLSNYDDKNKTITAIDNNIKTVEIESDAEEKEAVHELILVNNYDEKLTNVQIIGSIGYSNDSIASTFDTNLTKAIEINVENAKVYYSTNKDASYEDESWTEEFTSEAKACKIVINNSELATLSSIDIKEYVQIPQNLSSNQETYLNWNISYSYKDVSIQDEVTIGMKTLEDKLGNNESQMEKDFITPEGNIVPITLSITPRITQSYVHSGQIVIYNLEVKNNSNEDLENLVLTDIIPDSAIYTYRAILELEDDLSLEAVQEPDTKQKDWEIEILKAGETQEFEIALIMADTTEEQQVVNKVQLKYNEQIIEAENTLTIKPSKASVVLSTFEDETYSSTNILYDENSIIQYRIRVKNTTQGKLKDVKVQYCIPEGLEYQNGGLSTYKEFEGYVIGEQGTLDNNIFEYNINELEAGEEALLLIKCKVQRLQSVYNTKINSIINAEIEGDIYESNMRSIETSQAAYEMSLSSNIPAGDNLSIGDTLTYTIKVKNIGTRNGSFILKDIIPNEIEVSKVEYGELDGETNTIITSSQNIELSLELSPQSTQIINITGTVKEQKVEQTTVVELINSVQLIVGEENILSSQIKHKIEIEVIKESEDPEQDGNDNPGNEGPEDGTPTNPDEQPPEDTEKQKYSISGIAWLDENKDGKKDENEKLQENITVSLVSKQTGNFALDESGNRIKTVTDAKGNYTFTNIPEGTYIVLFEFDTNTYTVTTYQKNQIEESLNSDAILSTVTIDGQKVLVGLTDNILLNSNKEGINIGLITNPIFDLSLDKQITKITVINSQGTEVKEYSDGETAKVDLIAKYMNETDVIVNYKFVITNNGDITGYVNSLVDDLPSGLEFSSELNKDWYKGSDGKLYTTSLSGTSIEPGKSTEIELVLTKKMTEDNAGIFPNSAKLEKISNLDNITEKEDAIENNQSSATLIISIKTGSAILYMGVTTLCVLIILAGSYLIKKKVLDKGI